MAARSISIRVEIRINDARTNFFPSRRTVVKVFLRDLTRLNRNEIARSGKKDITMKRGKLFDRVNEEEKILRSILNLLIQHDVSSSLSIDCRLKFLDSWIQSFARGDFLKSSLKGKC